MYREREREREKKKKKDEVITPLILFFGAPFFFFFSQLFLSPRLFRASSPRSSLLHSFALNLALNPSLPFCMSSFVSQTTVSVNISSSFISLVASLSLSIGGGKCGETVSAYLFLKLPNRRGEHFSPKIVEIPDIFCSILD